MTREEAKWVVNKLKAEGWESVEVFYEAGRGHGICVIARYPQDEHFYCVSQIGDLGNPAAGLERVQSLSPYTHICVHDELVESWKVRRDLEGELRVLESKKKPTRRKRA